MKKILIVDDDPLNLEILKEVFETGGYKIETASDGQQAIAVLEKNTGIDLILTDLEMPRMNGREVTEFIKGHKPDLPVIIMTGAGLSEKLKEKLIAIGAKAIIFKPFKFAKLEGEVMKLI